MSQARDLAHEANSAPGFSPAGTIITFGGASAPTGYLACDGSAVSRTTYADLFAALSTTWGTGDGSTTFNIPDLRGAFLRGTGSHGTQNMANGNDYAGPSVGSFENDQNQSHFHNVLAGHGAGTLETYDRMVGTSGHAMDTQSAGGDEARPFNAGVLYCIKT